MRIKIIACLISSLFLATITTLAMAANISNSTPNSNDAVHQCSPRIKSAADCVNYGNCALCLKEVYGEDGYVRSAADRACRNTSFLPLKVSCRLDRRRQMICDAAVAEITQTCK